MNYLEINLAKHVREISLKVVFISWINRDVFVKGKLQHCNGVNLYNSSQYLGEMNWINQFINQFIQFAWQISFHE